MTIYALLLAWNDHSYQAVLLSTKNMTVSMTQGQLFADVDAACNAMMGAAIIYVLPPSALLFCAPPLRRGEPCDGECRSIERLPNTKIGPAKAVRESQ